jgi:glycosyltransferase involved in cell wall biosynthesis
MLSIIVPTLNEEDYLPNLLNSLEQQTYQDFEVIIADADSTDRTKEIAQRYGAKIVKGGILTVGRNSGAKVAKGELLLFLDADVLIEPHFIDKAIKEFNRRNLDMASFYFNKKVDNINSKIIYHLADASKKVRQYTKYPDGSGGCLLIKKDIFDSVKGFNEKAIYGEDVEFLRRVVKKGYKYKVINLNFYASTRRHKNVFLGKILLSGLIGGITISIGAYGVLKLVEQMYGGWGNHPKKD